MPRADEPRVTIRLTKVDSATLEAAAEIRGVHVGTMLRDAAMPELRRIVASEDRPRLRRRPASRNPAPAATKLAEQLKVTTARELLLRQRQERINKGSA